MRGTSILFLIVIAMTGCVSPRAYRRAVLAAYGKGFKVGRVIGRDDVLLYKLKSSDCFVQTPEELMNGDPKWEIREFDTKGIKP